LSQSLRGYWRSLTWAKRFSSGSDLLSPQTASGVCRCSAVAASISEMSRRFTRALLVASVPVGVGIGLWTALLRVDISAQVCGDFLCAAFGTPFARWQSALLSAVAAAVVLLASLAAHRFGKT
jgi:hypothetical protein